MFEIRKYTMTITEMSRSIISTYQNTGQGYADAHMERSKLQRGDSSSVYIVTRSGSRHHYDDVIEEAN